MAVQPPQRFELDDLAHVEREARTIYAPGATPGDVLVVQSDHSLVAAPGGGSMPVALLPVAVVELVSNLTLTGPATVDGADVRTGTRALALAQTDHTENGVWAANVDGAWTRPDDFTAGSEVPVGALASVGTPGNDAPVTCFLLYNSDDPLEPIVVGTSPVTYGGPLASDTAFQTVVQVDGTLTGALGRPLDAGFNTISNIILPTVDPGVAGALWNDAGTPAISTGPPPP